jgi:hypothetical protein
MFTTEKARGKRANPTRIRAPAEPRTCRYRAGGGLAVAYWKVIRSVRLSVVAFGFKGSFAKFALPEFKTL